MASQEQEVKNTYDYLPDTTASKVARDGQVGRIPFFGLMKILEYTTIPDINLMLNQYWINISVYWNVVIFMTFMPVRLLLLIILRDVNGKSLRYYLNVRCTN